MTKFVSSMFHNFVILRAGMVSRVTQIYKFVSRIVAFHLLHCGGTFIKML